jgi:hypothetical protein
MPELLARMRRLTATGHEQLMSQSPHSSLTNNKFFETGNISTHIFLVLQSHNFLSPIT